MIKKICTNILSIVAAIVGILIGIIFLILIVHLISLNSTFLALLKHFYPGIILPDTAVVSKDVGDQMAKQASFVVQFVSWIFTLLAFSFTALGFFGMKRLADVKETEERIEGEFSKLQKEHDELRKRKDHDQYLSAARHYSLLEQAAEAWEFLERIPDKYSSETSVLRGIVQTKLGESRKALDCFETALTFNDPDKARIYYNMGLCLLKGKDYDGAIGFFDKAIEEKRSFDDAFLDKARAYRWKGDMPQAIAILNKVICTSSNNSRAHYNMACYYAMLKNDLWVEHLEKVFSMKAKRYIKIFIKDTDFASVSEDSRYRSFKERAVAECSC